nr:helix-turn-helix transcriptional regulator [Caulobacter sp. 17J80-11]
MVVLGDDEHDPLLLEASPIPGEHAFRFDAAALLIARSPRDAEVRSRDTARALYGLTGAEAAVAGKLVAGLGPQAVAEQTGVSVGTVRSHIRRIFEKARVNSQLELVAAISARL